MSHDAAVEADPVLRAGCSPEKGCGCGGSCGGNCPSCASDSADIPGTQPSYVYGIGRIRPNIPNLGLEKEIAQTVGRVFTGGPSDEEALCALLAKPEHLRFARDICWSFAVDGVDIF